MLHLGPRYFTIRVGNQEEIISTSHLKLCTDERAELGVPCCWGRPPTATAVCLPPSRTCFQTRWCPRLPSNLRRGQEYVEELFLSHSVGGFCTPQNNLSFTASTEAVPATPADPASEIRPLTSPPSLPELRGTSVEADYTSAGTATVQGIHTLCALLHTLEMY